MSSNVRGPRWWQLYAMLPLLVGLFLLEMRLPFSETGHEIAQLVVLAMIFDLVHLWLRANASALRRLDMKEDELRAARAIRIYSVPRRLADDSEDDDERRALLRLPRHELKNLLGNTFELDEDEYPADAGRRLKSDISKN